MEGFLTPLTGGMRMRKGNIAACVIIIAAAFITAALVFVSGYNGIVTARETISAAQANIAAQLQRRVDMIPNLINSVKGYIDHENAAIRAIIESREKLMNMRGIDDIARADGDLTAALRKFNVIAENYPDLKANANFIQLQDELAGTENRIATARRDYNEAVREYNAMIKRMPSSFIAEMFGYAEQPYFEAETAKTKVPEVKF